MRTLTHSPSRVVAQWLVNKGLAGDPATWAAGGRGDPWPAFTSVEPPKPADLISVWDAPGSDNGRFMVNGELQGHYGVHVQVRSQAFPSGWQRANRIRAFMSEGTNALGDTVVLEGSVYALWNFAEIGHVLAAGLDAPSEKEDLFSINAVVNLDQTA